MGDVHSRRTPPFPSPTETVSPVAVPQPPHLQPPRSSSYRIPDQARHAAGLPVDATTDGGDGAVKSSSGMPRFSRGDSTEQMIGLTPVTEDPRSFSERQEDQGRSSQTLKELRRQMEELLVYQQMQQHQHHLTSQTQPVSTLSSETPKKRRLSITSTEVPPTVVHTSDSIGSGGTIKGTTDEVLSPNNATTQTPSYPFPKVQNSPSGKPGIEQIGRQGHFRLKLPSDRARSSTPSSQTLDESHPSTKVSDAQPTFLPPQHQQIDPETEFGSPSLYDLTLKLNADPGLEAWWSNLIQILQTHYGAERVSLAVPGDATDLENVPWGQKAVFNQYVRPANNHTASFTELLPTETTGDCNNQDEADHKQEGILSSSSNFKAPGPPLSSTRPTLSSRHTFSGFGYGKKQAASSESDQQQPQSKATGKQEKKHARVARASEQAEPADFSNKHATAVKQAVFPITRPLEVESDPLIKRTGVVKLFGRTSPVVLTREYSSNSMQISQQGQEMAPSPLEVVQKTPNTERADRTDYDLNTGLNLPGNDISLFGLKHYDEYEQIPQSPWSQSPAPSPAPRTHADQNPFFSNHTVDEGAFSQHPPAHDYSNTHPLEAIGIDHSKTVIHIPLLHGGRAPQGASSTLRFPVAIVSLLSTIVPYPSNLRQSLAHFMPHLTTSFCLAQQYSQLERQLVSKVETPRYGHLLGLGGTFSDASSELELVAGLSGHVSYSAGDETSISARASIASPSDRSSTKLSPAISSFGTPGYDLGQTGFVSTTHSPALISRSGDATDGYFNVQQPKGPRDPIAPHRRRLSKSKSNLASSTPTSPGRIGKAPSADESTPQDSTQAIASPLQETRPSILSPTQQSSRQASTNSFFAQLQRDLPRPFSDTIAQLMLNSIPLHLFLAKPQSGEVIWTNSKFDAYRRSKPQEHKFRDPWQNIHSSERDHVSNEWANALRTGSQFTERVRVRRFNDETAYRWFIFRANPLLSSTGEVLYWIGSFLDIHEQHIAELKANQEREKFATDAKYRAFSNSIPQVVFEATENRGLIFVNEQWNLYTGQKLEEALNLGFAKHVHPDDLEKCGGLSMQTLPGPHGPKAAEPGIPSSEHGRERSLSETQGVSSALDDLVRRGVASLQKDENGRVFYSTEIRLRSRGGDFRWHLVRLVCVETSSFGSEETSWYGTCTDINDRKNLERELNKAMSQLNNQMESKTKFFSNMSHEIRTPLNGILGTIPFILDTQLDSDQRRMLDTIQNSSTNLRELVDNILDVSRVEAGKMSMVNSWFHVRSMIEDVIDTIASRAIDKGLEINYLMDANVPAMVIGDRFRIRQILINLVGNAVKFTAQGEIYIGCNIFHDVSAQLKETEALLNFDVVDTGKGFSSQDAQRLMQRFSQLGENGSQQHAGSGLGLFLSKQLVEMHGGKLTPSSKEGQGAKFSFNVKVDAPPPPSPSERPRLLRQASTASRRPGTSRTTSYDNNSLASQLRNQGLASLSPGLETPPAESPFLAPPGAKLLSPPSASSSALPTPDINTVNLPPNFDHDKPGIDPTSNSPSHEPDTATPIRKTPPPPQGSMSLSRVSSGPAAAVPLQGPFNIVILCPLDNTRKATKQHIEQVVPHEIPFTIKTLLDVDEWKDMMQPGSSTPCTHLVLNLPATDDILEVIQHVSETDANVAPVVVIISDLYQKRQISTQVKELAATGKQVFIVPKPVKPSAFSTIFDPESKRELSKDRNQDMAREINNNFKTVSKMVKEVLGNKGYRILLVEDDETNRDVMLKYLDKIKLMSETASNGQECTDMVFSKEPGYYSLIICDIQMPIKNGYDTCREIRAWEQKNHYPQIPIMALSANAMTDQIENAARAGFNDYVTKPIKHNELGKMMMGLLDPGRPLLLLRDRLQPSGEIPPAARR
ncbi:hypothetical protein N7462_009523 [Penicillium macrosclerotiorum]|uniref:uncharacterized protein n=1 Tax=Penicillium macrosclerotiorum TaxID=303699 RepID=UPI002546F9A4|nr:uncharacterized protein N7462_009523 [Penicillium macrosclerotiorum]KAJ5674084.1 hypothetical protein N7462_009523 [Penicillium macrosclerotiorum]